MNLQGVPKWLLISSLVLILGIVAGCITLLIRYLALSAELPPQARPEAIETRFSTQCACLKELTLNEDGPFSLTVLHPVEGIEVAPDLLKKFEKVRDRMAEITKALEDPAILWASTSQDLSNANRSSLVFKGKDKPDFMLPLYRGTPKPGAPAVSTYWTSGGQIAVYEAVFEVDENTRRGFRLALDMKMLGEAHN